MTQQDRAEGLTVIPGGKADIEETKATGVVGSKAWASKIRKRAQEVAAYLESGYMEMARILYLVYDTPVEGDRKRPAIYTTWGYKTFAEYAEKELNISRKRAERLRHIWYVLEVEMKALDPDIKQRIVNLGFCKVRELIKVLTARNAKRWVEAAEGMNYYSLEAAVIEEKKRLGDREKALESGEGAGETPEGEAAEDQDTGPEEPLVETVTRETFAFFPAQLENVRKALTMAEKMSNSDKKSHNMDLICTDFLATNDFVRDDPDKRLRYIAKIERVLGLRLVAIDQDGDVLYGMDTLEMAAKTGET